MKREYTLFLQAVAAALNNEKVTWEQEISREEWAALLQLAEAHRVLPMVFEAVYSCPAAQRADPALMGHYKLGSMQMVFLQTRKTAEFLPVLQALREAGAEPLVVKGITCRALYPNPDFRLSSDEDVLIDPEKFALCHETLTRLGFRTGNPESADYELSYTCPGSPVYLEIHRSLFPKDNDAYSELNRFFTNARSRAVEQLGIPTMHPTDHLLYLLCHAFKHFLHSGFGLRQACDLILFANAYGPEIDWIYVLDSCRKIRAELFAAGLFRIGRKYLGFSLEKSRYPLQWQAIYVEEALLLEDILQSGVYGSADEDRLHSSNITLQAVTEQKKGKAAGGVSLLQSVFPPAKVMEKRYPYLKDKPMLLPIAWTERLLKYGKENSPSAALRIGNDRKELMKKYGILDK